MGEKPTIGYDASVTLLSECRGVARYTLELLRALVEEGRDSFNFVVLLNSFRNKPADRHQFLFQAPHVKVVTRQIPGPALLEMWRTASRPSWESLVEIPCDLVHAPASYIPPTRTPLVATVFDLGFLRDPGEPAPLGGGWFKKVFPEKLPTAAGIITPSRHVAHDVAATYSISPGALHPIHLGIDHSLFNRHATPQDSAIRQRLGLPQGYVLAVSDLLPRKRSTLVFSTADALREAGHPAPFVTVGLPREFRFSYITPLPWVSDHELAAVYRGARAVLLTTREEGFGFPLLEAMACGAPIVCGKHSSLAEISGDFPVWASPETTDGFAESLIELLDNPPLDISREAAAAHARQFTWETCARQTLDVYTKVLSKNG